MPFRSIERIFPFGRMLALPPPLRETVLPGRVRPAADLPAVAGFPEVPGFPVVPVFVRGPVVAPGLRVVPGLPVVLGLLVVPVLPVVPGLPVVPDFWPAVAVWPVVVVWLCPGECAGAEECGVAVCAGADCLGGGALLLSCCPQANAGTIINRRNSAEFRSGFPLLFLEFTGAP